jgi:predicted cupin superfamily sugar epimerase
LKAILTAADVIRLLDLKPHPEGGHFRETFRDASLVFPVAQAGEGAAGRAASTAIYYLLARGERSHWHRTDAAEVWNWYAGARSDSPAVLALSPGQHALSGHPASRSGCRICARRLSGCPHRQAPDNIRAARRDGRNRGPIAG